MSANAISGLINNYSLDPTQRVSIKEAVTTHCFKNQTNAPTTVWLYDCVARKDSRVNPQAAWVTGMVDQGSTGGELTPFSTPFQSDRFNQFWKVIGVKCIFLGAGDEHWHQLRHKVYRTFNDEYISGTNSYYLKGLTTFTMAVALGSLDNDSIVPAQVSFGAGRLNWFFSSRYTVNATTGNIHASTSVNALPWAFTNVESVMLEDADAAANIDVA